MVKFKLVNCLVAGLSLTGVSLLASPATALDDGKGNSLLDVFSFVGLGDKQDDTVVLYRERPPLVLPPKTELRQPLPPAAERTANWPKDPEAVRAAKHNDQNRYRQQAEESNDANFAGKLARQGRLNQADAQERPGPNQQCSLTPDAPNKCDPETYWKSLSVKLETPESKGLQPGVEPDRQFLTQPPKGYMAPKKAIAATFDKPREETPDPYEYVRGKGKPAEQ